MGLMYDTDRCLRKQKEFFAATQVKLDSIHKSMSMPEGIQSMDTRVPSGLEHLFEKTLDGLREKLQELIKHTERLSLELSENTLVMEQSKEKAKNQQTSQQPPVVAVQALSYISPTCYPSISHRGSGTILTE